MEVSMAEQESRRIRWHCRRGLLELDCVLLPFYERHFDTLDHESQQAFIHLLDQSDNDILAWLQKRQAPTENDLKLIVAKIRVYPLGVCTGRVYNGHFLSVENAKWPKNRKRRK